MPAAAILLFASAFAGLPAMAQTWKANGGEAGFAVGRTFNGLSFACPAPGRVRLKVSGWNAGGRLQAGQPYTVSLVVDGTGHLYRAKAIDGGMALAYDTTLSDLKGVIADLRKARIAEVSYPGGRFDLPLKGSGNALAAFSRVCGG